MLETNVIGNKEWASGFLTAAETRTQQGKNLRGVGPGAWRQGANSLRAWNSAHPQMRNLSRPSWIAREQNRGCRGLGLGKGSLSGCGSGAALFVNAGSAL